MIGYLGGLSGRSSGLGLAGRDGAQLAVEKINAAGGLDGRPVKLVVADDATGDTAPAEGVRKLVDAGALVVIGPVTSESAVHAIPVANELEVPLLSPTVSSTDFSGVDDFFLRTCADNRQYAAALVNHVLALRGSPFSAAAVYDLGNASYTERLFEHFRDAVRMSGGTVAEPVKFTSGEDLDYEELVEKLIAKDTDCVFIIANAIDSALVCQQLRKLGYAGLVLLSQWSASSEDLIRTGGTAVDGAIWMDNYNRNHTAPAFLAMKREYVERYGSEPIFVAVHSYDAVRLALDAIRSRGSDMTVKDALLRKGRWTGVQGEITMNKWGDTDRPFYPMTVRRGRFVASRVGGK